MRGEQKDESVRSITEVKPQDGYVTITRCFGEDYEQVLFTEMDPMNLGVFDRDN